MGEPTLECRYCGHRWRATIGGYDHPANECAKMQILAATKPLDSVIGSLDYIQQVQDYTIKTQNNNLGMLHERVLRLEEWRRVSVATTIVLASAVVIDLLVRLFGR